MIWNRCVRSITQPWIPPLPSLFSFHALVVFQELAKLQIFGHIPNGPRQVIGRDQFLDAIGPNSFGFGRRPSAGRPGARWVAPAPMALPCPNRSRSPAAVPVLPYPIMHRNIFTCFCLFPKGFAIFHNFSHLLSEGAHGPEYKNSPKEPSAPPASSPGIHLCPPVPPGKTEFGGSWKINLPQVTRRLSFVFQE